MSKQTKKSKHDSQYLKLTTGLGRRRTDFRGVDQLSELELVNHNGKQGFFAPLVDHNNPEGTENNLEQIILAMKEQMNILQLENHQLRANLEANNNSRKRTPDDFSTAVSHSLDSLQSRLADMKNPISRFAVKQFDVEFNVVVDVTELGTIDYRFLMPEETVDAERLSKIKMSVVPLPKEDALGSWTTPNFTPLKDVEEIQGVGEAYQKLLNQKNIHTVSDLLAAGTRVRSNVELSKMLGVEKQRLAEWMAHAELLTIKNIDGRAAEVLVANDIRNLSALAQQDAESLTHRFNQTVEELDRASLPPIDKTLAQQWILTARAFSGEP